MVNPSSPPRVLVVDDETIIANTFALILDGHGFQAKATYSAEQALDLLVEFAPDFLISDVVMYAMTGIDLAVYVTVHHPTCRVLLISGHTATSELLNTQVPPGMSFPILAKPVHPTEILAFLMSGPMESLDVTAN